MQPQAEEEADGATGEGAHWEEGIQNIESCFIHRAGHISRAAHLQSCGYEHLNKRFFCPYPGAPMVDGRRQMVASN